MGLSKKHYESIANAISDGIYTYIYNDTSPITNNKANEIKYIPSLTRTRIFTEDHSTLVYYIVAYMCRYFSIDNPSFSFETFQNKITRQVETSLKMKQQQEQTND